MANNSTSLKDVLNRLKSTVPKDLKNASADELAGVLNSLKDLVSDVSQDMQQNAPQEVKDKYTDGFQALDDMIDKGLEDPTAEINTEGVDEYINIAKKSKVGKKLEKEINE